MKEVALSWLVILVGVPVVIAVRYALYDRRIPFAAGWALARWISSEPWRPPAFCALLGLLALGVAVWAAKLDAPVLFVVFVLALLAFLAGVTGVDFDYTEEAEGEPGSWNQGWWRRTRF